MPLTEITKRNFLEIAGRRAQPWQANYAAMYSTQWGGFTTDPDLMLLPMDDHLVHRGDGVFDVMRAVKGKIYLMEQHLTRLNRSAEAIELSPPPEFAQVRDIITRLLLATGARNALIRIILSRGPGSFSVNPFDCPASQMYINIVRFEGLPAGLYREGVSLVTSRVPVKHPFFAHIKSCNYLPNALMKLEAVKAGSQYAVSLDEEGHLAEGSTENVVVLTADNVIRIPEFEHTLAGITANRVFALAQELKTQGIVSDVAFSRITPAEAHAAREIFLTGTSVNVLPVVRFDGRPVGAGRPGPVFRALYDLLWQDITANAAVLTALDWPAAGV